MNSAQDTPQVSLGGWVAPFGDPGITDRSHLPRAFRSVPRPSSPLSAKASTRCPCFALDHRIAVTGDAAPPPRTGPNPMPAPATAGSGGLYEDTSLGQSGQALLAPACPPRSHHNSLFTLQPTPPRSPAAVSQSSPNVGRALGSHTSGATHPAAPLGAAPLYLWPQDSSFGKTGLCRWWR